MSDFPGSILAIDTALNGCAVAVLRPDGAAFARLFETGREQAAKLVPLVQETLREAGCGFPDISLIITTIGPGSFTGLRIGLSTARSMGLALRVPVQGVDSFSVMARSCAAPEQRALVVLESKRTDFYVQAFGPGYAQEDGSVCLLAGDIAALAEGRNFILCGDASARLIGEVPAVRESFTGIIHRVMPDPAVLARHGLDVFLKNNKVASSPQPLYMREADVSVSNKINRQINDRPL